MEWKLELNLWTKTILTRGSEFLMDWISWSQTWSTKKYDDNEQETSETKTEVFACSSSRTVPIIRRILIDIEPGAQFDQAYPVAKRLNTLLRHRQLHREEDGAIEFWRLKEYVRHEFEHYQYWSDEMWKSKMAGGGGNKKRFHLLYWLVRTRNSLPPSSSRSFSTQSHWSYTSGQCVNSGQLLRVHLSYWMCRVSLHSITNSRLIAGGQNSSRERQTVFFTAVNPMNKEHTDPQELELTKPRLESYKQKKWRRYQDTVYWVDIQLAQRKGSKFYQTRCNAIILYDTLPAYCIPKVVVMESGEIMYEKGYVSPRPPQKISYKDYWMCDLDSEVAGSRNDNQRIQPKPKTQLSRTVRPVCGQESTKEIEKLTMFWSRGCHRLNQYGEPCMWIRIHKALCVDTYTCWRRSNKNGETGIGGGARHWFQSTRTVTCSCERSRTSPSSRACEKDRKSSSSGSTSCRIAAE